MFSSLSSLLLRKPQGLKPNVHPLDLWNDKLKVLWRVHCNHVKAARPRDNPKGYINKMNVDPQTSWEHVCKVCESAKVVKSRQLDLAKMIILIQPVLYSAHLFVFYSLADVFYMITRGNQQTYCMKLQEVFDLKKWMTKVWLSLAFRGSARGRWGGGQSCTVLYTPSYGQEKKADQVKEVKTPVGVLRCKVPSKWQQYIYNI